jgi:hypothetical protein
MIVRTVDLLPETSCAILAKSGETVQERRGANTYRAASEIT